METAKLEGKLRTEFGKNNTKKLIQNGEIPVVILNPKKENIHGSVRLGDLDRVFKSSYGRNALIELTLKNGEKDVIETVISHTVEEDNIKHKIIHADFKLVNMRKPVDASIKITLEGNSPGEKAGGILIHKLKEANVKALPNILPEEILVNISELEVDGSIQLKDVSGGYKDLEFLDDELSVIVRVEAPKVVEERSVDAVTEGELSTETTAEASSEESAEEKDSKSN